MKCPFLYLTRRHHLPEASNVKSLVFKSIDIADAQDSLTTNFSPLGQTLLNTK